MISRVAALDAASVRRIKRVLFAAGLGPFLYLVWLGFSGNLGADPVEFVRRSTGTWTLDFLIITLAVTPLRRLTGWHWLTRLRRMFGLYAFFYALIHVVTYLWLDQLFDPVEIWRDIVKRPLIAAGVIHFWWLVKVDFTRPLIYGLIIGGLLAARIVFALKKKSGAGRAAHVLQA